jgi:nitrile hydratase beta subunit
MNGVHDLGGMHGFGRIDPEPNEPVFHHEWEKSVFGISVAAMAQGLVNVDEFRYGIEQMVPAEYLASSYYEHWLATIETNLVKKGIVGQKELQKARDNAGAGLEVKKEDPILTRTIMQVVHAGGPSTREPVPPKFKSGDRVRTKNLNPVTHIRLPRYTRGKVGTIERMNGTFVTPDTNSVGQGEHPQPVYTVRFTGEELWGAQAEKNQILYIDLWESYLETA